jgi:uncharacterized protein (TIGR03437 family)
LGSGFSLNDPIEATSTPWPTTLGGVRIRINGAYAPITFVSDTMVHFQCPTLDPGASLEISMEYESEPSLPANATGAAIHTTAPVVVHMTGATPGIYQLKGTQGAAMIAGTGIVAGPAGDTEPGYYAARPALAGENLEIYANGLGVVSESLPSGQPAPLDHLLKLGGPVTVVFGDGRRATADFAGLAPGTVGLFQVNVTIPEGVPAGDSVPFYLELTREDGTALRSNTATLAIAGR